MEEGLLEEGGKREGSPNEKSSVSAVGRPTTKEGWSTTGFNGLLKTVNEEEV